MNKPLAFLAAFGFSIILCAALLPVLRKAKAGQEIL